MSRRQAQSNELATRLSVTIIPVIIIGTFGFATWAIIDHLCVRYLIRVRHETGTATAFLVLYAILFPITIITYIRLFYTVQTNPGAVPWSDERQREEEERQRQKRSLPRRSWWKRMRRTDPEEQPWNPPDANPDSPGLENFYSKNVFVCEVDGRPRWCSECRSWKPDRAHHSRELGRCIRKMDHLCPWVGGMVSETGFNFFFQFTAWCFCYCVLCLVLSVYCLVKKKEESGDLDGVTIAGVALSAMFGFFAFGMTATSGSYMLQNKTTVDMLRKDKVHQLAVRVPRGTPSTSAYRTITYPLSPYDGWPTPDTQIDGHDQAPLYSAPTNRDVQATRTFAILKTEPGENPWDLGPLENFKAVMGNTIWEWLLPIRHSPCCNHDSMDSDYQLGPVVARMARRVDLPRKRSKPERVEMVETNGSGR